MLLRCLVLAFLFIACKATPPRPEGVAHQFLIQLTRAKGAQAHQMLCKKDQMMLAALASRMGQDPIKSLSTLQLRAGANFKVEPIEIKSTTAQVQVVATGGMRFSLQLSRQGPTWCLHLPELTP